VAARETEPSRAIMMKQRRAWVRGSSFICTAYIRPYSQK
jgi:hypothetical protein